MNTYAYIQVCELLYLAVLGYHKSQSQFIAEGLPISDCPDADGEYFIEFIIYLYIVYVRKLIGLNTFISMMLQIYSRDV